MSESLLISQPVTVIFFDSLEKHGLLKQAIELGQVKSRSLRACRIWKLIDVQMRVHAVSKMVAVQYVSETTHTPVREIHRLLFEISDVKRPHRKRKKRK